MTYKSSTETNRFFYASSSRRVDLARLVGKSDSTITLYFEKIDQLEYNLEKDHEVRYFIFGGGEFRLSWFSNKERHYHTHPLSLVTDENSKRMAIFENWNASNCQLHRRAD